jgi:putative PIN family toxin of toxin-antitoxin system
LRAVLDVNALISATLASRGPSARIVRAWRDGEFELIVSPLLLDELQRAFNYLKIRERVTAEESHQLVRLLQNEAVVVADPQTPPPIRSPDQGDDYLLALAANEQAVLVSQDQHLLSLGEKYPIQSPDDFLKQIADAS